MNSEELKKLEATKNNRSNYLFISAFISSFIFYPLGAVLAIASIYFYFADNKSYNEKYYDYIKNKQE